MPPLLDHGSVQLRSLTSDDVSMEYVNWLNDPLVNQYLESRFMTHTLERVRAYVASISKNPAFHFFLILRKDTGAHIGNIKLGTVHAHHGKGSIGVMIGERSAWGHGFATAAVERLVEYAFNDLSVYKLTAGAYAPNVASLKLFAKIGFMEEGRRCRHVRFQNEYVDYVLLAKFRDS
jgi:[ribosomal protein S5]-alanine N-acetyltransferase